MFPEEANETSSWMCVSIAKQRQLQVKPKIQLYFARNKASKPLKL